MNVSRASTTHLMLRWGSPTATSGRCPRATRRGFTPLLKLLGMGQEAAPITIIGMTLGLVLGGGLVIQEAKSGKMKPHEIFFSLSLMCIFHSLIEDTAVVMLMGGHLSGLLWLRLVFTFALMFLMVKVVNLLPENFFNRFLFRNPVPTDNTPS